MIRSERPNEPPVVSAMRLLMIDNYDSFTFNLVQYLGELGCDVDVVRNDAGTRGDVAHRSSGRRNLAGSW